ncbi:ribonuclease R [Palleronia caenipelagi]|uniref:Ribonuclease R n=1 Tax=Palleronia caenipelagi TaxID=2489174 RepID=A0A547Q2K0_9RHOB|nr:ribonuclease R [Palleronia caenipelagi]TRD20620.1 ribonuclease R [Palleronia caenipelagi]
MAQIPSKAEVLQWISDNPTQTSKRDIARAFGLKGADRIPLKRLLRELEDEGHLQKRGKTYRDPEVLPPVSVCEITDPTRDGDLLAKPLEWRGSGAEPRIFVIEKDGDPALGRGHRVLLRLTKLADGEYEGRLIRKIGPAGGQHVLGILRMGAEGARIVPVDKGTDREWRVRSADLNGAEEGELVEAERTGPKDRLGLPWARIVARLGDPSAPKSVSLIAIHQHGIPDRFPEEVIAEAEAARPVALGSRTDLRHLPLITIDPADARDHDDAVCAMPDDDPANPGGHVLWVAIADVAHYVRPGSPLDREARLRGNSTYFPDRVVPMLPEALSGDLCSLHEGVERACLAVRMVLAADGTKIAHQFHRGLMKSPAALTYEEVQAAHDGQPDARTEPLLETVIRPLYAAYDALREARARRQPLELDLPERRIELDDSGQVTSVAFRDRLDAHRLIEEFMVLANVAAAEELKARRQPLVYRVHEEPSPEKLDALREVAVASGLTLAKGQVLQTAHLNRLLAQAAETDVSELINISTLRAMTQAYYNPENFGHFGLALRNYAHFTSPIRRYADLIVHRALIAAHGWGDDGLSAAESEALGETAEHISQTERRSMLAERDTVDRYLAAYLAERIGDEIGGRVSGVQKFGLFVKLDETGADGLVPVRALGHEYFDYDRDAQTLMGVETGRQFEMGQRVLVRIADAAPVTGGLILDLLEVEGESLPKGGGRKGRRAAAPRRFKGKASAKARAKARKINRSSRQR